MTERIRTVLFGLGPIGAGIGRLAADRAEIELVGAIDIAPEQVGRSLSDVLGVSAGEALVSPDPEATLASTRPQLVLHATGSYLPDVLPQLIACARARANVVSTCEELSYPWRRHPELAKQIDAEAKANGVSVLGTGINPGFMMDTLVVSLAGVCQRVERVRLVRMVDVSTRREQLQRKVGVGLSGEEFAARVATGRFGHVGLKESCWLIAEGLGWRLDSLEETIEQVPGGRGIRQTAIANANGRSVIEALVEMSTGAERPRDEIAIEGTPPVRMVIEGGVPGDSATASVLLNAAPHTVRAEPGLITMLDLPPLGSRGVTA